MSVVSRLNKLRTMSAAELGSRVATASYRFYERRTLRAETTAAPSSNPLVADRLPAAPFLPALSDLTRTRDVLLTRFAAETQATLQRADLLLAGQAQLFGRSVAVPADVDWHRDPVSGRRWPLVYHRDVPIGDRDRSAGDAKDVWELNRHQFLIDLGKAWLVTADERYFTAIRQHVSSWIDQNPYGFGINWAGPLEAAYRALSWMWLYHFTRERLLRDRDLHVRWLGGFECHGRFLHRHLELYESPYNHLIGEASVLFVLGTVFPHLHEAARWRARGRRLLESRLAEQFHEDGGSVEQAVGYHHATLGFYLLAASVARLNLEDLSPKVWRAIERATEFSMWLTQPDGLQPALGDNDDARPFAFAVDSSWDYRHFQAAGAVLFGRADFKGVAGRFFEDALWIVGPDGVTVFDRLERELPPSASCSLDHAGYVVLRSSWNQDAAYVLFDRGPQAGGLRTDNIPSAAHGHADALAIVAHLAGTPILVDSGFYCYDGEREWERHFRETAAHNTVRIDGCDQAQHLEKMAWARVPTVTSLGSDLTAAERWAGASHDGYARDGVTHQRAVHLRAGYVAICDEIAGVGEHDVEVIFQFHDALAAVLSADAEVRLGERFLQTWVATVPVLARVTRGGPGPADGWVAPRLGHRLPASRLVLTARFAAPRLTVVTVLVDRQCWSVETDRALPARIVLRDATTGRAESISASKGCRLHFAAAEPIHAG
jgi:hypothetical protein